ncbi:hypothetical protein ACIPIN_22735 [Pseudomonas sp. NPDC087697]|uniref:hypothetical protein n=1 Tax=Pseudomonas sp. NPDC087697 TaxID=3364447 RepID=UPI0037FD67FE
MTTLLGKRDLFLVKCVHSIGEGASEIAVGQMMGVWESTLQSQVLERFHWFQRFKRSEPRRRIHFTPLG